MYDNVNFYATIDDYYGLYNFLLKKGYRLFKGDTDKEYNSFKKFEKTLLKNSKGTFFGVALNVNISNPVLNHKSTTLHLSEEKKIIYWNELILSIGSLSSNKSNISSASIIYPDLEEYLNKTMVLKKIFPAIEPKSKDWENNLIILEDIKCYIRSVGKLVNGQWILKNALVADPNCSYISNIYECNKNKEKLDCILDECEEFIRKKTKAGFDGPTEIYQRTLEKIAEEYPNVDLKQEILNMVDRYFYKKIDDELKWTGKTDAERLNECFAYLKKEDLIYTKQNFTSCLTEGNFEILKVINKEKNKKYTGYAYFHKMDLERAIDYNWLFIAYGSIISNQVDSIKVGKNVCDTLEKYGFRPEWNGCLNERIKIPIIWKKRMFT